MKCVECQYRLSAYDVCKDCNKENQLQIQSLQQSFEKLIFELNQIKESERGHLDKLHHRNMLLNAKKREVEELKKELKVYKEGGSDICPHGISQHYCIQCNPKMYNR